MQIRLLVLLSHLRRIGSVVEGESGVLEYSSLSDALRDCLISYSHRLDKLLAENRWAFWDLTFWTPGHWRRRDPELQKILARLYATADELLRRHCTVEDERTDSGGRLQDGIPEGHVTRILLLLEADPSNLTLDAAIEVFDALDRILIEIGDARFVCEEIAGELPWSKGSTTWMTWDSMFDGRIPKAVETYQSGKHVPDEELEAARHMLASFRRTRSDDYQVHRARQKARARNLRVLSLVLLPLVVAIGWLIAEIKVVNEAGRGVALIGVAGALGAAISGTIRSRDKLIRGSDLRAFRAGLPAQVLMGAAAAFVSLLLLKSRLIQVAGTEFLIGQAAFGFVAGFSEPFFLKTVERVAKMGEETTR